MISFLILPMQRVTRLPLLLDVSKSEVALLGTSRWSLRWLAEPSRNLPGGPLVAVGCGSRARWTPGARGDGHVRGCC